MFSLNGIVYGYFYNAEIIKFNNQIEETKLKREFEEAGYPELFTALL